MDVTGYVTHLGWSRWLWVSGFQSHHIPFCLLRSGHSLPCTNKYIQECPMNCSICCKIVCACVYLCINTCRYVWHVYVPAHIHKMSPINGLHRIYLWPRTAQV